MKMYYPTLSRNFLIVDFDDDAIDEAKGNGYFESWNEAHADALMRAVLDLKAAEDKVKYCRNRIFELNAMQEELQEVQP
mgnify:CR=1 FL=1